MRKIFLSLMAICLSFYAFGQKPLTPAGKQPTAETQAKELTKKMKDIVQFSDQQEAKVYELNLQNINKRKEITKSANKDREVMKQKMEPLQKEYEASLKKILNEKQFSTYLKEKQNIMQRAPKEGQGKPANKAKK